MLIPSSSLDLTLDLGLLVGNKRSQGVQVFLVDAVSLHELKCALPRIRVELCHDLLLLAANFDIDEDLLVLALSWRSLLAGVWLEGVLLLLSDEIDFVLGQVSSQVLIFVVGVLVQVVPLVVELVLLAVPRRQWLLRRNRGFERHSLLL